jgi:cold shock CspA family protein
MTSNKDVVTPSSESLVGRVKWFNNKAGYGFITVTDGTRSGSDIFIHHSAIEVENQQYKYLVQGEYVEFNLVKTNSTTHEWQASNVNGINGGKLMCETRREYKLARSAYRTENSDDVADADAVSSPRQQRPPKEATSPRQQRTPRDTASPRQQRAPRVRGEGPRDGDKKEWTLVSNKGDNKERNVRSRTTRQGATVITIESK